MKASFRALIIASLGPFLFEWQIMCPHVLMRSCCPPQSHEKLRLKVKGAENNFFHVLTPFG